MAFMKILNRITNEALMREIGARLAAIRVARNLTQGELAEQAGLGLRTVQRLESGAAATQLSGFLRVCRVLDLLENLETVFPEASVSPMAQLKGQSGKRKRVRVRKSETGKPATWTWGDEAS